MIIEELKTGRRTISTMRFVVFAASALFLLPACGTRRVVTISTKPADAVIKVDGKYHGTGPIEETFWFGEETDIHRVSAARKGYKDMMVPLNHDFIEKELVLDLKPQSRRINLIISPIPATIFVDGKPVKEGQWVNMSMELEFTVDAKNNWTTHTISAERVNYRPASAIVSFSDVQPVYRLKLEPVGK